MSLRLGAGGLLIREPVSLRYGAGVLAVGGRLGGRVGLLTVLARSTRIRDSSSSDSLIGG